MKTRFLFTGTLVSLLILTVTLTAMAAPVSTTVHRWADASIVPGASASLVRTDNNVAMRLHTSELDSYGAYTIWWVVFNNPGLCSSACGEDDIFETDDDGNLILIDNGDGTFGTPGVNVSVLFATGHVVGSDGVGNFGASLKEGRSSGEVLFGPGLIDAQGAEIHLVVRTHGELVAGMVNEQISTFDGGCDVNFCDDQQFAVFTP